MTDETTAPTAHERGMAALRTIDAQARAMWTVSGPRDTPGKISGVILRHSGARRMVILHSTETDFDVYAETDKDASLEDALTEAFGGDVA